MGTRVQDGRSWSIWPRPGKKAETARGTTEACAECAHKDLEIRNLRMALEMQESMMKGVLRGIAVTDRRAEQTVAVLSSLAIVPVRTVTS